MADHVARRGSRSGPSASASGAASAASWRGRPITSASDTPTCSIPIATSLRPTVWRQRQRSETSWWIVPSRSIRKCAQTPAARRTRRRARCRERVECRAEAGRGGVVLDDHLRVDAAAPRRRRSGAASSAASGACGRRRTGSGPSRSAASGAAAPLRRRARGRALASTARRVAAAARAATAARPAARRRTRSCPASGGSATSSRCRGSRQPARRQPDAARVGADRRVVGAARERPPAACAGGSRRSASGRTRAISALQRARLGLARRGAAREVGVERPPAAGPAEREVAVEVDAARVLPRAAPDAVGVGGARRARAGRPAAARAGAGARHGVPAVSLPWIEPTTSTRTGAAGSPARRPRAGGRRRDVPYVAPPPWPARASASTRGARASGASGRPAPAGWAPRGPLVSRADAQRSDRRGGHVRRLARLVARPRGRRRSRSSTSSSPATRGRRRAASRALIRCGHGPDAGYTASARRARDALARARGRERRGAAGRVRR